jgi:BirA family transcriptional regulator, biotin operon repressor / biotin---[acetyl-CoA-carboxylase] ligase
MPLRRARVSRHDARAQASQGGLNAPRAATRRHWPFTLNDGAARAMNPAATRSDWRAEELRARVDAVLPGIAVQVLEQCDSTNTSLLDACRGFTGEQLHPHLLVAEQQSHGRGRQGRVWVAQRGASLTFSLALALQRADVSGLSLAVGVAIADALDEPTLGAPRLMLKWPNDLWLLDAARVTDADTSATSPGRKLGGVLIETVSRGTLRAVVIGIGLNVLALAVDDASSGVATLSEIDAAASAPQALHRLAVPLALALRRFDAEGFAAFEARYQARDLLFGRAVTAGSLSGTAQGVAGDGALLLRSPAGPQRGTHRVVSGEVSVRLQPQPPAVAAPTGVAPIASC